MIPKQQHANSSKNLVITSQITWINKNYRYKIVNNCDEWQHSSTDSSTSSSAWRCQDIHVHSIQQMKGMCRRKYIVINQKMYSCCDCINTRLSYIFEDVDVRLWGWELPRVEDNTVPMVLTQQASINPALCNCLHITRPT